MRAHLVMALAAVVIPSRTTLGQEIVHEFLGEEKIDFLGVAVDGAGDVDGDGCADVVAGAWGYGAGARAQVHSGRTGEVLHVFRIDSLSDCAGAGDVDGDGFGDVILGDAFAASQGPVTGQAVVFSGASGEVLLSFTGSAAEDRFGTAVGGAGDVNRDGHDDVIVGATQEASFGPGPGYARVFSGLDGAVLHELTGDSPGDRFGGAVSGAGDVDADGYADVIVGAYFDDDGGMDTGSARVFSGRTGGLLHDFDGASAGDQLGRSVSAAGDVDADGYGDLFVGSPFDRTVAFFAGKAEVFSGLTGAVIHTFFGDGVIDELGSSVGGAGDVDGDGRPDLVAGAPDGGGFFRVYSGVDGSVLYTVSGGANLGVSVSVAGDVDGDCLADVVAGDPIFGDVLHERGRVLVTKLAPTLASTAFCFGDGSGTLCPCGNPSAAGAGEGCANSSGFGAEIVATGGASVAADDLRLLACRLLPGQAALLFAGPGVIAGGDGIVFGDGLRCVGGGVVRLGIRIPDEAGTAVWGPGLRAAGGWASGDTRRFQVWYRDPLGSPCGSAFNLSNGLEVTINP